MKASLLILLANKSLNAQLKFCIKDATEMSSKQIPPGIIQLWRLKPVLPVPCSLVHTRAHLLCWSSLDQLSVNIRNATSWVQRGSGVQMRGKRMWQRNGLILTALFTLQLLSGIDGEEINRKTTRGLSQRWSSPVVQWVGLTLFWILVGGWGGCCEKMD